MKTIEIILYTTIIIGTLISALLVANTADNKRKKIVSILCSIVCAAGILVINGPTVVAVREIIVVLALVYASLSDINRRECDDFVHVIILVAGFIGYGAWNAESLYTLAMNAVAAVVIFILTLVTAMISNGRFGGADIKLSSALTFALGPIVGFGGLLLGNIAAVISHLIMKKDKSEGFPLIPYIAAGAMVVFFVTRTLNITLL